MRRCKFFYLTAILKGRAALAERDFDDSVDHLKPGFLRFVNFNEKEEATVITSIQMLRFDYMKTFILLPFMALITVFVLPLRMYWSAKL